MPSSLVPPRIVQTQDEPYAFIHLQIPRAQMHQTLPAALQELQAALKAQGLPIKPWFAHHLTLGAGDFNFEVCLPVDDSFVADARIERGLWPAGTCARSFYQGDYAGLPAAWEQLHIWLTQNGHAYARNIYERYVVNRRTTQDPTEFRTELSWPLLAGTNESEPA